MDINNNNNNNNRIRVVLLALICCVLWGSAVPVIKTGYRLLGITEEDASSQILFGGIRFFLAGALVILLGSLISKRILRLERDMLKPVMWLATFQTVGQYVFFYIGAANVSGVKGSIITGLSNFFAILIACLIFRQEKFTRRAQLGCALGISGVLLINLIGNPLDLGFSLQGEGCYTIAAISCGISTSLIARFSRHNDPVALSGYQFMLGGLVMSVIGMSMKAATGSELTMPAAFNGYSLTVLMYLAMVSAVAYTLWSVLLKNNPVSQVAVFGFTTPIFGSIISAIVLNETEHLYGMGTLLSLALVCAGIIVINRE